MQMSKVNRRQTAAPMIQNSLLWSTKSVQAPYREELKSLNTTSSNVRITLDSNCKLYSPVTLPTYILIMIFILSNLLKSK